VGQLLQTEPGKKLIKLYEIVSFSPLQVILPQSQQTATVQADSFSHRWTDRGDISEIYNGRKFCIV